MSRAHGKHTQRQPVLTEDQRREYGIDDRDIPGGATHLINPQVQHATPAAAEPLSQFRGMMAHGVPPEGGTHERATRGHKPYQPEYEPGRPRPVPVPVYIVEQGGGSRALRHAAMKHFQAPPIGAEPVSICGQDTARHMVRLLNEAASGKGVRIGQLGDLALDAANGLIIGGALLPAGMTSYLPIETQGPIYAISLDANTPVVSVIIETETAGAA